MKSHKLLRNQLNSDAGMTMVEVIVAFLIIAICMGALLGVVKLSTKMLVATGEFDDATAVMQAESYAKKQYIFDETKEKFIVEKSGKVTGTEMITLDFGSFTITCNQASLSPVGGGNAYPVYD